ncbi:MAG: 2-C-methyl-D-erythritol 4-phosphate cytidylyltransferase [Actinomycetota bacterium]
MSTAQASVGVIVVAAGSGTRLGYGLPKAQVPLAGEPILAHALRNVLAAGVAARICVAVPAGDTALRQLCAGFAAQHPEVVISTVDGGASRAASVAAALRGLGEGASAVLVHDAARALTPPGVFQRVAAALAAGARAVVPAVAVVDTIKTATPSTGAEADIAPEKVAATIDRALLRAVQTPQGFDAAALAHAHESLAGLGPKEADGITDEALLMERSGVDVMLVPGSAQALKITTQLDLAVAEALLAARQPRRIMEG